MDPITIALALLATYVVTRKAPARAPARRVIPKATVANLSPTAAPKPKPGAGVLNTTDTRPGVYVIADERNTRHVHVYAERAGLKFVKLTDRGDALVWRSLIGQKKQFPKYSTSRFLPLDPLIGSQSGVRKLAAKLGDAATGVGAFFTGRWVKAGQAADRIINENRLAILSGKSAQVAARVVVFTTAAELVERVYQHPRNKGRVAFHWAPDGFGGQRRVLDLANGSTVYIPTPED